MEIRDMSLGEIETRFAEIRSLVESETDMNVEQLEALTKETDLLEERKTQLNKVAEERAALIEQAKASTQVIAQQERGKDMEEILTREQILDSKEYRDAWLKQMMGKELTEAEKRSVAVTNVAGAVPTSTVSEIVKKMREVAPLMSEIRMLFTPGNLTLAVEGTNNAAALHTENGLITGAADTLVSISLGGYELAKLVRISESVSAMTIADYEAFLVDILAENLAVLIEEYIIYGTGSNQPKGINYAASWTDGTNGVDWAGAAPVYAEIIELASYLKGGYFRNAKWLMNHKTFFNDIQAIRDDSKLPLVKEGANGQYFILGKPVLFSDYVKDGEMFLGDFKKVIGNLQKMEVRKSLESGFAYGSIDYRGLAIFDCDIAIADAFVKGEATLGV
jgi:HK97 family phage major capsid protein